MAELPGEFWDLIKRLVAAEVGSPFGVLNLVGILLLFAAMVVGGINRLLFGLLDRLAYAWTSWLEYRSAQSQARPFEAKDPPKSDSRYRFFLVFAAAAVACPVSLVVLGAG